LIHQATGAPAEDLARIENIMREEVFHSTLDWQTRKQLADAARQAHRRLNDDRELYDLDHACRVAMFQKMRAEAALREHDTPEKRAAVETAEAQYQAAKSKLFAQLHGAEKN
jgi:hypothetical protein